ncbi:hypothetical protein MSAS_45640 [Mycobacterium saskatchewanense]|uniref:Uncharacterized protein n=1 Tax=Mycobacterium saskatchewanense TaxID=220927 RepID=A0A7I7M0G0_9MYCO|nr:hypothetical protein MSAS_45640 [Mycobacterium saskatchewanense]
MHILVTERGRGKKGDLSLPRRAFPPVHTGPIGPEGIAFGPMRTIGADYLVVGAGAMGVAFIDTLVSETCLGSRIGFRGVVAGCAVAVRRGRFLSVAVAMMASCLRPDLLTPWG